MKGELVYSRSNRLSVPLLIVTFPPLIIVAAFAVLIFSKPPINLVLLVFYCFILIMTLFLTNLLYTILRGFDYKIHEHAIEIRTSFMTRQFGQKNPVTIMDTNIRKILYLNRTIHIYHFDEKAKKVVRSYIMGGRWFKEFDKVAYHYLSARNQGPRWHGPPVYNIGNVILEDLSPQRITLIFFGISLVPLIIFIIPMWVFISIASGFDISFMLWMIALMYLPLFFPIMLVLLPLRILDRKTYKFHSDRFSVQGSPFQFYTEYFFEEIEQIQKKRLIPILYNFNIKKYRYFENPYSSKNCTEVYLVKFRDDYRIFERGEYKVMKESVPFSRKKFQYLVIPEKVLEAFIKKGARIKGLSKVRSEDMF